MSSGVSRVSPWPPPRPPGRQDDKKAEEPAADEAPAPAAAAPEATAPPAKKSMLMWAIRGVRADRHRPAGHLGLHVGDDYPALPGTPAQRSGPPALVEQLDAAIKERKFQEAYDACRDNESFLARLVRTGVANLPNGRPEAKEAMTAVAEEIVMGMEPKISYLAIIGQLGPMIGLVGTIMGMIMSFQEIATAAGSQPKPEKVAEGISTALFITLEGVVALGPGHLLLLVLPQPDRHDRRMEATKVADRTIAALVAAAKQAKSA